MWRASCCTPREGLQFAEFMHRAPAFGFARAGGNEAGSNPNGLCAGQDLLVGEVGGQVEHVGSCVDASGIAQIY